MLNCRRFGFTLIELLVVLAIIGVLIGLFVPGMVQARDRINSTTRVTSSNPIHLDMSAWS